MHFTNVKGWKVVCIRQTTNNKDVWFEPIIFSLYWSGQELITTNFTKPWLQCAKYFTSRVLINTHVSGKTFKQKTNRDFPSRKLFKAFFLMMTLHKFFIFITVSFTTLILLNKRFKLQWSELFSWIVYLLFNLFTFLRELNQFLQISCQVFSPIFELDVRRRSYLLYKLLCLSL